MAVQIPSSVNSVVSSSAPVAPSPQRQVVAAAAASTPIKADSVRLSLTAQVHLLRSQGQSAQQIGSSLGLSAAIVSGYLGAQPTKAAVKVEPPAAPAAVNAAVPQVVPTEHVAASQVQHHA